MNPHKDTLISISFEKAFEALEEAELLLNNDKLHGAQNRIYYAVFYSVVALGYYEGFTSSNHKKLLGWFNKKFVYQDKVFEQTLFETYKIAYENRMKGDYTFTYKPNKDDVLKSFESVKDFIEKIKEYISNENK